MLKNKKILVTGGAGFIGSNLVRRLLNEGAEVFVLVRKSSNLWRLDDVKEKLKLCVADLADELSLKNLIQEIKPQGVFHLGATTIMSGVISEPEMIEKVNVEGTKNLIKALGDIDYDFFINTSTYSENSSDDYAKSKRKATDFCTLYAKENKKPIITLRIFTPYGPYIQKGRLIFQVLTKSMRNENIEMSSPDTMRDFIYIDDLIDLYITLSNRARENAGEAFNAGFGVLTSLKEVANTAITITNSQTKVIWGALPKLSYDFVAVADITKNAEKLGWKPKTTFEAGMKQTYSWLKENLHRYD